MFKHNYLNFFPLYTYIVFLQLIHTERNSCIVNINHDDNLFELSSKRQIIKINENENSKQ